MALPNGWVERLFMRFSEIYEEKFTAQFRNNDIYKKLFMIILKNALCNLSNAEIKRGLHACNTTHRNDLPSVIHFWHLCKGIEYKKRNRYGN